jgi:hypothetical protein
MFQALMMMSMKMAVFWDVAQCSLVDIEEVLTASIIIATSRGQPPSQ